MITLLKEGRYELIETKEEVKILTLDSKISYAWKRVETIGEILITSHKKHIADHILSLGTYRLYNVIDESNYSDQLHLELLAGRGVWQGYLLLTGFPTDEKTRSRIVPTHEVISKSYRIAS